MSQLDFAYWSPIGYGYNSGLMQTPVRGLVVHITDGHGDLQTVHDDFDRPDKGASAHFGIDRQGSIWQYIDTSDRAWAIDGGLNDSHWISVENVAKLGEQLTEAQLFGCALLLEWFHGQHDVPFELAHNGGGRGLGYHRMFHIGDHACPGGAVVRQLESIRRWAWYLWARDSGEDAPDYITSFRS